MDIESLRMAFSKGQNVMQLLRSQNLAASNAFTSIQLAYDLQAGSYTQASTTPVGAKFREAFGKRLASFLPDARYESVLDAGTGEGTSILPLLSYLKDVSNIYAYDGSVSRVLWARKNFLRNQIVANLFVGDTAEIPLPDCSIDLVFSIHSIEPNGGREEQLLSELLRVARMHVVLVEPSLEFATSEQQARMQSHGYATGIWSAIESIQAEVLVHEPWPLNVNPENPAAITVLKAAGRSRESSGVGALADSDVLRYVSPRTRAALIEVDAGHYSPSEGLVFPSVAGFPILLGEKAILATQLLDDFD